jgi:NAD(P)-dependent dehydrogenase (short-subunit alcohol dehydrogenase family)
MGTWLVTGASRGLGADIALQDDLDQWQSTAVSFDHDDVDAH